MTNPTSCPEIGIVDPCCSVPYAPDLPQAPGGGGTEATVCRIVRALRGEFRFALFQTPVTRSAAVAGVSVHPLEDAMLPSAARAFLVINSWKVACRLRRAHPDCPISLWLHVYPGRHNRRMGAALHAASIDVICVSRTHVMALARFLAPGPSPRISHIYNPVDDTLRPDATQRNPQRLLYASSPHKGLAEVFSRFRELRLRQPALQLRVADPGYLSWETGPVPPGVRFLGRLDHGRLMREMRRALCLFVPQTSFAETFGLVFAEANALGLPVLAQCGLGANDEILTSAGQLIDAANPAAIAARIESWQRAPLKVALPDRFRLSQVVECWRTRLNPMRAESTLTLMSAAE